MAKKKAAPVVIVTDLGNGYFQLKAENGVLYSLRLFRAVSEAVVPEQEIGLFVAR